MKNVKYFLAIIIFLIFHPINSFSQSNFSSGYVIDLKNDTLKGLIEYNNWNKTPDEIVFKNFSDSKLIIYKPAEIKCFSVAGEVYISAIVAIDESPFRDAELSESFLPQNRIDTVFLQILVDGPKSLYYLNDKHLKVHFFISQTDGLEPLVFVKYHQNINRVLYVKENTQFKGQLVLYLQDYPSIQKKIYSVTYSKNDLIKLFNYYYKCTKNELVYLQETDKFKSEIGLLTGLSKTKLKFAGTDFFRPLTGVDFPWSTNFTIGGFFNIVIPRTRGRLSIDNELMFLSYKTNGQYRDDPDINIYTISNSSFGESYIKLNNLIRFKFPLKKYSLFVDGGISNGISISQTNYMKVEAHVYSINNISEHQAFSSPRSWERGFLIGLGCNIKNYLIEYRFERADGMSDVAGLKALSNMHLIIFGYKF